MVPASVGTFAVELSAAVAGDVVGFAVYVLSTLVVVVVVEI